MHYPAGELEECIYAIVTKKWLFAGANIYGVSLLHEDYAKRLVGLNLACTIMAGEELQ